MAVFDFLVLCLLSTYVYFRHHDYIKIRGWQFSTCLTVVSLGYYHVLTADLVTMEMGITVNCEIWSWTASLFVPLFALTFMLRGTHTIFQYYLQLELGAQKSGLLTRFRHLVTLRAHVSFYLGCTLFTIILAAIVKYTRPLGFAEGSSADCISNLTQLFSAQIVLLLIFLLSIVVFSWRVDDAFYIKTELKVALLLLIPLGVVWVVHKVRPFLPFPSSYMIHAIIYCAFLTTFGIPVIMVLIDRRSKQQYLRKRSVSPQLTDFDKLKVICTDPGLEKQFKALCVRAWCVENLLFFERAVEYRAAHPVASAEKRKADSWEIYSTYIKVGARLQVNLDMALREEVFEELTAETFSAELFDACMKHVFQMLQFGVYREFSTTPEFLKMFPEEGSSGFGGGAEGEKDSRLELQEVVVAAEQQDEVRGE